MTNDTQYNNIAEQYSDSKQSDVVRFVESPTFFKLIGDVQGKSVLDLACGDGFYTRQLQQLGATTVVGVDISSAMIDLANAIESKAPQSIRYVCADVAELPELGTFDTVVNTLPF